MENNMFDIYNDDLDILEIIDFGFPRRINIRPNYYEEMDNMTFFKRFRLLKPTVLELLHQIEHNLEYPDDRNNSVSPINQLLCCLRFYSSSGHLSSVADFMKIDVATASRIVRKVSREIASLYRQNIQMPEQRNLTREQEKFYNMHRFPRIIGIVDGTQIRINSPGGDDPEVFRNRKGYFSINTQVVANADLNFVDVVARWPGSAHDSTIFANSRIRSRFEHNEFENCLILGDSGYPLKNYLMTPIERPRYRGEQHYNDALTRTRNLVERTIGIWKRRFPVIAYGLRLKLETVMNIIVATAVLHNLARNMNEPEPPLPDEINEQELNYLIGAGHIEVPYQQNAPLGYTQNELINYFANL